VGRNRYKQYSPTPPSTFNLISNNITILGAVAHLEHPVLIQSSPENCFNALELLLQANKGHAVVFEAKMSKLSSLLPPAGQSYLTNLGKYSLEDTKSQNTNNQQLIRSDNISKQFWETVRRTENGEQVNIVETELCKIILDILKHEACERLDCHEHFPEVGLDSLMMFEFKNSVQDLVGAELVISMEALSNNNTVNDLAKYIMASRTKHMQ